MRQTLTVLADKAVVDHHCNEIITICIADHRSANYAFDQTPAKLAFPTLLVVYVDKGRSQPVPQDF